MFARIIVLFCVVVGLSGYPASSRSSSRSLVLTDPINDAHAGYSPPYVRIKRERDVVAEIVDGVRKGGWRRRRRQDNDNAYKSVGKLDSKHPFRKKVRPVEKPITPYFVRILRRHPVGPSAMNYTTVSNATFENSDNGEIIDVPRVLVDKRRNKNVDIHPIYVVEDDDATAGGAAAGNGEEEYGAGGATNNNDTWSFVPTSTEPKSSTPTVSSTSTTSTTTTPPPSTEASTTTTSTAEPEVALSRGRVPIVRFTRVRPEHEEVVEQLNERDEEEQHDDDDDNEDESTTVQQEDYYPEYSGKQNGTEDTHVDYLPLEYDYEKQEGEGPSPLTPSPLNTQQDEVISSSSIHSHDAPQPLRLISVRGELPVTEIVTTPKSKSIYETVDNHDLIAPSKKRVLHERDGPSRSDLGAASAVYADYGYRGVLIGGGKGDEAEVSSTAAPPVTASSFRRVKSTTTTTEVPTTTTMATLPTTTTTLPTTTTTLPTTTTTLPTTTTTLPTTTTTLPTTTTTLPTTTTTLPTTTTTLPTTTTTLPTTTTTLPTTTLPTTTTTLPTTTIPTTLPTKTTTLPTTTTQPQISEEALLAELLNSLPQTDPDNTQTSLSPQDQTTLQQLILSHILSTPATPPNNNLLQSIQYTNPPDLQTSASTTTALFSTRADVTGQESPRTTTTRNPLLLLFDNLTGNSNQQQRSTLAQQPQQQVVSIVRPITTSDEAKQNDSGNFMRMLFQLPGNMLAGFVRAVQTISQMGINMISGLVKFMSGLGGGGTSGGGLFGG